jgi:hypothetical protein
LYQLILVNRVGELFSADEIMDGGTVNRKCIDHLAPPDFSKYFPAQPRLLTGWMGHNDQSD